MADVSHVGGLIAAGAMANPFDHGFDVVTTTTHKTLRGPRAGMILCRPEHAAAIDRSVFPGLQGGPHMNTIAAVAVTLRKAQTPEFRAYGAQVLRNAKALATALLEAGMLLVTGGTDNHMMVLDVAGSLGIDGASPSKYWTGLASPPTAGDSRRSESPLKPVAYVWAHPAATTRGMRERMRPGNPDASAMHAREDAGMLDAAPSGRRSVPCAVPSLAARRPRSAISWRRSHSW
jgi:glycine hydroxymethyltransferase